MLFKNNSRRIFYCILSGFIVGMFPNATFADTCFFTSIGSVNFGSYSPFDASPDDSKGSFKVNCTGSRKKYTITASPGASAPSYNPRTMKDGAGNKLNYNLYIDAGYSIIWGDGVQGGTVINSCRPTSSCTYTVFGRIPSGQTNVVAGDYKDNAVTMTIKFK